ncbi:spore germination protein [Halobacillus shinanisalinarum]|uniref:Spore germination protein n=1 Tax=Halobacillus shinanisalinarum TaxID=2932258 RepID=A0ABY4GZ34_9BACI|nr:spore germination protein [Halobacillus shinanisalinarum]UOQ93368.1 spore germination protein [Halobacillus shinanisalinarum]
MGNRENQQNEELNNFLEQLKQNDDFKSSQVNKEEASFYIGYFNSIIDKKVFQELVMSYMKQATFTDLEELSSILPSNQIQITEDKKEIEQELLNGKIAIFMEESTECLLVATPLNEKRQVSIPEVEFSVVGPKEAFIEDIETNLNLIRKRIPVSHLMIKEMNVGSVTKTTVAVAYIEDFADAENVKTVIQRIKDIDIDQIVDSSFIQQLISDDTNSPFPQLLDTERPDRIASVLTEGKVAILVDGSPHVLIGPTTLVEFFSAFEDYFLNWIVASIFRMIRLFAVTFSILVTPFYVAILTHHFDIIPESLLATLISSRAQVPFPPILEALILELTIELLREAGARLPTKVGQTIGIVGGIVIGTASVEAGLTSNVLLIIVALGALGSFTTPVYKMSNTIRLMRFPFLLFAHVWGLVGITICMCYVMVHLLRLTSLGRPFLEPVFPFRFKDLKDAFIRLPFRYQKKRPLEVRTNQPTRFEEENSKR